MLRRALSLPCALGFISVLVGACGDDSLGKRFVPKDPPPPDQQDLGPTSPISEGAELVYFLRSSYKPLTQAGGGGLTENESQRSAYMCLKVDEVQDTAETAYKDAQQTKVVARTRVSSLVTSFNNSASGADAAPEVVDSKLASLWLTGLTFPSSGHGLDAAKSLSYNTRTAPVEGRGLADLPFFDTRSVPDKTWLGWEGNDDTLAEVHNYLNELYGYFFLPPFGASFFMSTDFQSRSASGATCPDGVTPGCYSIVLVWRENRDDLPPEFYGPAETTAPVLHRLRFEYNSAGILRQAGEYVVPDLAPASGVPNDVAQCLNSEPCLNADVEWYDDMALADASCAF